MQIRTEAKYNVHAWEERIMVPLRKQPAAIFVDSSCPQWIDATPKAMAQSSTVKPKSSLSFLGNMLFIPGFVITIGFLIDVRVFLETTGSKSMLTGSHWSSNHLNSPHRRKVRRERLCGLRTVAAESWAKKADREVKS